MHFERNRRKKMTLSPWVILPGVGKITIALAFIVFARLKGGSWRYLGLGALAWIVTIVIKFLVATPLNPVVYQILYVPDALFAPGSVLFYVYVGVLTGLTEVLLTWLLLRYTHLGRSSWTQALAFGIGFGALEALYMGIPNLISNITALAAPQSIPEATLRSLQLLNDPLFGLAPATDRFAATLVHIFGNVLLFYGVASMQARWLWVSFVYKSLVDTVAAFAIFISTLTLPVLWSLEVVLLVFGCMGWWGLLQIQQRYRLAKMPGLAGQTAPNLTMSD
jgi:uncharacterized membrane protein YhfC